MVHKKSENQVRFMLADTILALCGSTISYESEVRVEGLLGVTIDDQEVFLVQINKCMRKGAPKSAKKGTAEKTKSGKSSDKSAGKSSDKSAKKSEKEKSVDRSPEKSAKKDGGQTDKTDSSASARYSKRKRKATWKVKLNLSDDHDYTGSPEKDKDVSKRKKKTAAELGLIALDSSDSDDEPNDAGDDDEDAGDVLAEQEVVYVNESGTSRKSKAAASDSSDSDDDDDDGFVQSMPDIEPLDSSPDDAPPAGVTAAEVVRTSDGQMVVQLTSDGKPITSAFEEPRDAGQDSSDVQYRRVEGGTIRGQVMLTDSIGYSYVVSKKKKSKKCEVVNWRCSVRGTVQKAEEGGLYCLASVIERNGIHTRGRGSHCHPPIEGIYSRLTMGKLLREEAHKMENLTVSASQVFEKVLQRLLREDPAASYNYFMERKDTLIRRFTRFRKDFLAKHSVPAHLNLRRVVKRKPRVLPQKKAVKTLHFEPFSEPATPQRISEDSLTSAAVSEAITSISENVVVTTTEVPFVISSQFETRAQVHFASGDEQILIVPQSQVIDHTNDA